MFKTKNIYQLIILLIVICTFINCKSEHKTQQSNIADEVSSSVTTSQIKKDPPTKIEQESKVAIPATTKTVDKILSKEKEIENSKLDQKPEPIVKTKQKKKKKRKPKIEFEELTWDFGEITEGDIIERKFKFTNTGNAPLQIIATSATCGCTRPSFPFLDIAPGESNVIGVNYNSVGKNGEQSPEVTIESNTYPKISTIKLHGTVVPKPKEDKKPLAKTTMKDSIDKKQ